MKAIIHSTEPDSIARQLGLLAGDAMITLNGHNDLEDLFDYQFEVTGSEYLELGVRHTDGTEEIYEISKDPEDELGIVFSSPVFTPIKTCNNACPFCFIDQQPEGLRDSLYLKDDDWRLSYFVNTYITLTNLTDRDKRRIETLRPGPLYVSVHSTVPEIREILLKNKKAGDILDKLRWLKSLEIPFHAQIVVCPGINDGESLSQSIRELAELRPEALSVAVVPVGLTQYRDNLPKLDAVEIDTARRVIEQVTALQKEISKNTNDEFVFLSDEFYIKAGLPFPNYDAYGEFPQLDDGVGTARMLLSDFAALEPALPQSLPEPLNVLVLSGKLGLMILQPMINRLNQIEGLYVDAMAVESRFWGSAVDVAGLVTGSDIIQTLTNHDLSGYHHGVIPSIMLKQDSETFLDGKTVSEVSETISLAFKVVQDTYSGKEFLHAVLGESRFQLV